MVMLITAPLGAKAQVTLPKAVRKALHLQDRQDMVGFIIQNGRVALTRIEPVPSRDPFTDQEWRAIDRLADQRPTAAPGGAEASLRYLQRHLRRR